MLLLEVVERAVVVLGHAVLCAEDVGALAGDLDQPHLLAAGPALARVRLNPG